MIDPEKLAIVICCETMRENLIDHQGCCPQVKNRFPPYLVSCDGDLEEIPIVYCPWCGRKIEKRPVVP